MGAHEKMRSRLKRVGGCASPGHGQGCEVTREIREDCVSRSEEKDDFGRYVDALLHDCAGLGDEKALHLLGRGLDPLAHVTGGTSLPPRA